MRIIGSYLKKYTLKTHIVLISTAILLVTFASIITYSYQKNAKSITDVSLGLLKSAQESVKQSMYSVYLDSMNFVNYGSNLYHSDSEVQKENLAMLGVMREMIASNDNVYFVCAATESGKMLQISKVSPDDFFYSAMDKKIPNGSAFSIRQIEINNNDSKEVWFYENRTHNILDSETIKDSDYDPRARPWYKNAIEKQGLSISETHVFSRSKKAGVIVSIPVYSADTLKNKEPKIMGVFGVGLTLDKVSEMLNKAKICPDSKMIVMNGQREVAVYTESKTATIKDTQPLPAEAGRLII